MKPELNSIQLTLSQLNYSENPLWKRIAEYQIDQSDAALPFSRKLGQTEGWTRRFCLLAIEEYKRFIYLCCVSKNGASPSMMVDKVWHMHLLYTTEYWKEFCPDIFTERAPSFPEFRRSYCLQ
ncbi:glycine-rich domain-containing protein [Chryseobacterium luteum]|uniref:glycine-rich domain-containing protein n=1 Tax=Chryseobacterium luteum TaxID=421531 RepID=UPI00068E10C5|nr:hypothetical protein [Chryseobacterium luteum]